MSNIYPEFKVDGRIFPLWILHNFKKYKLESIISSNLDDCNIKKKIEDEDKKQIFELKKYQAFIGSYLDYRSPYKDILLYHSLGSGKTATTINVYNMLYNYNPGWNVFFLLKASLKQNWLNELKIWMNLPDNEMRMRNIQIINYDSPIADKDFIDKVKSSDITKKNLYIIDEAHIFIGNVRNNIIEKNGKKALTIYDYIQKEKENNNNTRVILISGTPVVNYPYELVLIFNLLRPGLFPTNEIDFMDLYIKSGKTSFMNPETKNMFQRRIMGLVSYYKAPSGNTFAEETIIIKKIEMSEYHKKIYEHYEAIEKALQKKNKNKNNKTTNYKSYTRQSCNFVFPFINDKINGENRPRPSKLNLNEDNADRLFDGKLKDLMKKIEEKKDIKSFKQKLFLYTNLINEYVMTFDNYLMEISNDDVIKKHTLKEDIEIFKNKYNYKFKKFWKEHTNKSKLLDTLYMCSCKMLSSIFYMMKSKGPILYFSNFVKMEGLELFKIYLKYFDYTNYNDKVNQGKNYLRYIEFNGDVEQKERYINISLFNKDENKYGEMIKIILFSPAGYVGINLMNIRQIHILDPYWNENRIIQLIGRGNRQCSHKLLPLNERKIDIFRYLTVIKNVDKLTTDEKIYNMAKDKQNLIDTFYNVLKEVAIDCELFKNHNMVKHKYKCFKFNEKSYFDKQIGPSYKDDVYYDKKINDGLNNINSKIKRIKVIKINAVKKLDDGLFSEPKLYWYNNITGVIYDYDLDYPIGKTILKDGIPNKLDKDTYIIDEIINIPEMNIK